MNQKRILKIRKIQTERDHRKEMKRQMEEELANPNMKLIRLEKEKMKFRRKR